MFINQRESYNLKLSVIDSFFVNLMIGAGECFFPALALALGMSASLSGLFQTLPMLIGACIQMLSPFFFHFTKNSKKLVIICVMLQSLSFLPFIYFAHAQVYNVVLLFLSSTLYWAAGMFGTPSWYVWMSQLISAQSAGKYFALRLRAAQAAILLGLISAGTILHTHYLNLGFAEIFFAACTARFACAAVLFCQGNSQDDTTHFTFKKDIQRTILNYILQIKNFLKSAEHKRFFYFLFLFYISITISSPFVSAYFLTELKLDYIHYTWAVAALYISKAVFLPLAQKMIDKWGAQNIFILGAIGISPLPAIWALNQSYWLVILLQAVSGVFWMFFEVGTAVLFFNKLKASEKVYLLTIYNLFNAAAMLFGTLLGETILKINHETLRAYALIFIIGSVVRTLLSVSYWQISKIKA